MTRDLEKLHEFMIFLEEKLEQRLLSEKEAQSLKTLFLKTKAADKKLSSLGEKIKPGINLKQFMCFLVPVERALNKKITDSTMLISKEDSLVIKKQNSLIVVLDNLRSAFNVGAAFRTCEALGVKEVLITGYTPGLENEKVKKTSMGSWRNIKVTLFRDLDKVKDYLKKQDYEMICVETVENSISYFDAQLKLKTALVFGNERFGLDESQLLLADKVVSLPVFGLKNSININAALTACGYEWVRQNI